LNANSFFNNKNRARKPNFSQQQFGGTIGGPLYKNHTFWFFSYQGLRAGTPQDLGSVLMPTAAERGGTISDDGLGKATTAFAAVPLPFAVTGAPNSTVCPNTTCPAGTLWNAAFPLDANKNITIPTSNFNPVSLRILKDLPVPASGTNTFAAVGTQTTSDNQWSLRIDQNWKKDQLFGYFFWRQAVRTRPFSFTGGSVPGFGDSAQSFNRQLAITEVHTFSSSTINELRVGYNRLRFLATTPVNIALPSSFGFTGINPQHPDVASGPLVNIVGFTGAGAGGTWGFSNNGPQPRVDATFQYADSISKIWRSHNFKFGIDFRRSKIVNPFDSSNNGVFTFGGSGTFSSGNPLADFLLGIPDSYSQSSGALNSAPTEEYYGYVQDTWQIRPTVTIVYGLGYQVDTPYQQQDNFGVAQVAFRPGRQSTVYPTAPPGVLYTGDPGIPRGTVPTRFDNFGPRLGIVWSPGAGRAFSIRAGVGIFYNLTEGEATLQFLGNPPLGLNSQGVNDIQGVGSPNFANPFTTVNSTTIGGNPSAMLTNKFPGPTAPPIGSTTFDFKTFEPFNISILDPTLRVPRSYNFNLTIERQLLKDLLVRVGYVGAQGRNLYNTTHLNPMDTVKCASIPACRNSRPFTNGFGAGTSLAIQQFDGTIYGPLGLQQSIATSHYNSFQTSVEKRVSHGLFLRANYTFSKSIDDSSGLEDSGLFQGVTPGNPKRDMSFSGFDARHNFTLSYDWRLPLPKPSNSFLNHILQSWTVTGVTAFETGFPIQIIDTSQRCLVDRNAIYYDTWCRPDLVGPVTILDPRASDTNLYFNKSAFAFSAPPSKALANGLLGNAPRNAIHGPGLNNFDFAVLKDTHITESKYFQFRGEFYNLFNHTQFSNPSGNINSSRFGRVISTQVAARIIQLALKFYF
jgi:hypothetical protein